MTAALVMRPVGRIVRFIRNLVIGLGFGAGVLLGAAAPTVTASASSAEQGVLAPTPEPLANFTRFELRDATMSDAIKADPDKVAVANALVAELGTRLRPVIDEWNARQPGDRDARVLVIHPHVREIRVVSNMSRLFVGALAGNSYVDLDLVLTVASADASFATARIHREASATSGGTSRGRSDENLIRFTAAIARQYLLDNYRPE